MTEFRVNCRRCGFSEMKWRCVECSHGCDFIPDYFDDEDIREHTTQDDGPRVCPFMNEIPAVWKLVSE